eukprot:jgi/Pico_ML_1/51130/g2213.t1
MHSANSFLTFHMVSLDSTWSVGQNWTSTCSFSVCLQLDECFFGALSLGVFHDHHYGVFRCSLHVQVFVCEHGTGALQEFFARSFVFSSCEVGGQFWDSFGHCQSDFCI